MPIIIKIIEKAIKGAKVGVPFNAVEFGKNIAGDVVVQTFFDNRFEGWTLNGDRIALAVSKLQDDRGEVTSTAKFGFLSPLLGNDYGNHEFLMNSREVEYKRRLEKVCNKIYEVIGQRKKELE